MKRALVLQHMDYDTPGRFADFFAEDGIHPDTVRIWEGDAIPSLAPYDLMFVLGGAQDVFETERYPWLEAEKEAIREWVGVRARPYLGLCLGHQLLADAMGGAVGKAAKGEVGVYDISVPDTGHPFVEGLAGVHKVMQWHFMEVKALPPSGVRLATSDGTAVQALAVGDCALGLQFHIEFSPQTIASWRSMPNYVAALDRALGPGSYEPLARAAYPLMPGMGRVARRLYDNLMRAARTS
jgi:GMP synthase-like glutamine amidotransferase